MLYLATPPPPERVGLYRDLGLGVMITYLGGNAAPDGLPFAVDTGCFTRPDAYNEDGYLAYLDYLPRRCLFATAPDVLGDAEATWRQAEPVLPKLRSLGHRPALVAQDGFDPKAIDWHAFDVLFVGGMTAFKCGRVGANAIAEGLARGKRIHVGRVNSGKRYRHFRRLGAHSADGTFTAFGPDINLRRLSRWGYEHPSLFVVAREDGHDT